jgi:hypothetical protein
MSEFDPTKPSRVHDVLNDRTFAWKPEWAAHYRRHAKENGPGVIEWDGRLLDGWSLGDVVEFKRRDEAPPTAPD